MLANNRAGKGDILGHKTFIDADKFTSVDSTLIPTGELKPAAGSPFDFRQPTAIGARIGEKDPHLLIQIGHMWPIWRSP